MKLKKLNSVGSAIDMNTGLVYPLLSNFSSTILECDFTAGVYVEECSNEWLDKIDENDHSIIHRFFVREDGLI